MNRDRADWSRQMAETIVLPELLPLVGVTGRLVAVEAEKRQRVAEVLDVLGGVDFWVETPARLVLISSRVQRYG